MIRITILASCILGLFILFYVQNISTVLHAKQGDDDLKNPATEIFLGRDEQAISEGVKFFGDECHDFIGIIISPDKVQIHPEELKRLSKLSDIRIIDFRGQQGLQGNLDFLNKYKFLETLNMSQSGIKDEDIKSIVRVGEIKNLLLNESKISDDGVKNLVAGLDVQHLHLSGCKQLTNAICEIISGSKSLQAVYISGTSIDQEHIINLHNQRPDLAIAWNSSN